MIAKLKMLILVLKLYNYVVLKCANIDIKQLHSVDSYPGISIFGRQRQEKGVESSKAYIIVLRPHLEGKTNKRMERERERERVKEEGRDVGEMVEWQKEIGREGIRGSMRGKETTKKTNLKKTNECLKLV